MDRPRLKSTYKSLGLRLAFLRKASGGLIPRTATDWTEMRMEKSILDKSTADNVVQPRRNVPIRPPPLSGIFKVPDSGSLIAWEPTST